MAEEIKLSNLGLAPSLPNDTIIYVVVNGVSYKTTKEAFLNGAASGSTPISLRANYNGVSFPVPLGFTITRIISLNDIQTSFTGVVTGTELVIQNGVTGDIYLIDGY